MYCRHCGTKMNENQAICILCGVPAGKGNEYCSNCGQEVSANAAVCVSCGVQINGAKQGTAKGNSAGGHKRSIVFPIVYTAIAVLTTIFMLIPDYILYYSSLFRETWSYSFINSFDFAPVPMILLWVNPILAFVGHRKNKGYSIPKILLSSVLFIWVLLMSVIDMMDYFGSMFWLVNILLLGQVIFSIVDTIMNAKAKALATEEGGYMTETMAYGQQADNTSDTIFCRNCGVSMNSNQAICIKCGVAVGNGNAYCGNCGSEVSPHAEYCMHCGVAIKAGQNSKKNISLDGKIGGQDKITMALICFFLGGIGVHNFMMGESKKGVAKILLSLIGVGSILALIDFVKILTDNYEVNCDKYF